MGFLRNHLSKIVIVALLVLVVGVPFALQPTSEADQAAGGDRLVILTPHNEQIRYEFARGFNLHRAEQGLPPVRFDWRASGGTSDLRKSVLSQFQAQAASGNEDAGIGADLFFGGGEYEHNKLASGVTVTRDGDEVNIPCTVPPDLPEGLLEAALPEPTIGGERLYRADHRWIGTVLSSFGIVYNNDVLGMLEVDRPRTWQDLGDPKLANWIALADPAHSGSIAATYETILRRRGWAEGWATLRRCFANARYFTASSSKVPVDVSSGEAAAGMCIDFYGRFQAGAVGGDRVGYIDPRAMTATTADPISVLRGAPHMGLANRFVAWVLSKEAQRLWQRKAGAPGGPEKFELRRQPIRSDMYTAEEKSYWTDPEIDPFGQARPIPEAIPSYYNLVWPVAHAMAIDITDELGAAWAVIRATPDDDPIKARMLAKFDALPEVLRIQWPSDEIRSHWQEAIEDPDHPDHDAAAAALQAFSDRLSERYAGDPDRLLRDRQAWSAFFRANYQQVVALGD